MEVERRSIVIRSENMGNAIATIGQKVVHENGDESGMSLRYEISPELMGKIATLIDTEAIKRLPNQRGV